MYLHLGGEVTVPQAAVVGIFDLEGTSVSARTREFLRAAEKRGEVVNVTYEMPRSFVVTRRDGKTQVYICQLSAATLRKRQGSMGLSE